MKINTIKCLKCNDTIISYHRHDYKICKCGESFIDGGIDYTRCNIENCELIQQEIKDVSVLNRNSFTWGKNYNEKNERLAKTETCFLKDLTSSHICGILSYFNNRAFKAVEEYDEVSIPVVDKQWLIFHEIFIQELDYRIKNNII